MVKNRKSLLVRIVAVVLTVSLFVPMTVGTATEATVQPRASYYLDNYNAYVYLPGDGEVRVYFNVQGTDYMDELGVLSISIYECSTNSSELDDWTWVKTFTHDSTPGMLSYNDSYHSGYVSVNGYVGRYYKAYVCVWGGENGAGDARYFWTAAKH